MNTNLAIPTNQMDALLAAAQPVSVPMEESVHLVARNPVEMQNAQAGLKAWLTAKIASVEVDVTDFQAAIDHAKQNKWATGALSKAKNNAVGQRTFYEKILAAVEAGYTIVPEFPVDVFAIRVTRETPKHQQESSTYRQPSISDAEPDIAPQGEGEYKSPQQMVQRWTGKEADKEGKEVARHYIETDSFADVVFPVRSARVEVMDATAEAMALKVFDRIGICPQTRRGSDPLIIGQVLGRKQGYSQKVVSFIIAWHLDLRAL